MNGSASEALLSCSSLSEDLQSAPSSGASLPAPPWGGEPDDQNAPVRAWLFGLVKTLKAARLYNDNSELLQRFVLEALQALDALLAEHEELSLFVREDRLVFRGEDVLIQPDREDGLPFVLYRNAFRRVTFRRGWTPELLLELLAALNREIVDRDPELDLISRLWTLQLPGLGYVTIDPVLSASHHSTDATERQEIEDLQEEIEGILAAIYQSGAGADDLVENLNIDQLDLMALKRATEEDEDLEVLDRLTARAIMGIDQAEFDRAIEGLRRDAAPSACLRRLSWIFVDLVGRAQDARDSVATGRTVLQLVDSLIAEQDYEPLVELARNLRSPALSVQPGARYALDQLTLPERLGAILTRMGETAAAGGFSRVVDLVAVLGAPAVPVCLDALVGFREPGQRRALVELLIELGTQDPAIILQRFGASEWFIDRELLTLSQSLPAEHQAAVILKGLEHENAQVRIAAVGLLRGFREGTADRLLAGAIMDPDLSVRLAAIRVAAARRSQPCLFALRDLVGAEDFVQADPRLIRLATLAYARLAGDGALPVLGKLMKPGFFAALKSMDAQLAAIVALGALGTPAARALLEDGARSLNRAVREACKKALLGTPSEVEEDENG